jgi:hypothetical protein
MAKHAVAEALDYLTEAKEIEECIEPFKQDSWIKASLVNFHLQLFC